MVEGTPGAPFEDEVVVRRRRWASEDSGFAVLDADRDGDEIVLVGPLAHLEERERARVAGVWQDDRRFGLQVKVAVAEPLAPAGDAALLTYLRRVATSGSRAPRGCSNATASDVLEAIDQRPARRVPPAGLSPSARARRRSRGTGCAPRARCTCCSRRTGSPGWCRGITATTATRAHDAVRRRPYELTSVFGVGFATADTIARARRVTLDTAARAAPA